MAEIKLITTEVGKNNSAITIGIGAKGADEALAIGVNAGQRGNAALGERSIDIRTADNGIFLGNSGESTAFGAANTDYAVFKVGGTETVLTAAQFRALLGLSGDISSIVDGGSYDSVGKKILLKHGNTTVAEIDATDFIKDGMVSSVAISGKNLVISFNTDAGKEDISIPLKNIFDPDNYYNKKEADELLDDKQDTISDLAAIRTGSAAGATALQPVAGKGLSTNDFTNDDKSKLDGIAAHAQVNPTPIDPAAAKDSGAFADAFAVKLALDNKVDKPAPEPAPDGTAEHPYLISSYADLEQLRQDVADGSEKRSAHYLQTADIDLGNVAWEGIGLKGSGSTPSTGHSFEGTYDGGGHAIKNLTFKHSSSSKYIGFFHAAMGATIKNLTINVNGFANLAAGASDVSGAAFVGLASDGLTIVNCTANGNMGSEARPLNGNSAGIIAYVNVTTTKTGKSTVYLENVTNNVNVYCTRKTGGIIAFMVENLTMKNVVNNGTVSRISSDTGDGVGAMVAWSNGDTNRQTEYVLENIVNTGTVKASTSSKFYGQMFGQWGMNNGGGNYNTGYTTIVCDQDSLPLAANWDPNIPAAFGLWFGEIRDDGLCHVVSTLENGCEYVYLFKNVNNSGTAITSPMAYTLPSGYTVTIDQRFDAPNIVDSNGDPITGVRVGETDKYTYTAA